MTIAPSEPAEPPLTRPEPWLGVSFVGRLNRRHYRQTLETALSAFRRQFTGQTAHITIFFTDDDGIRRLNRRFRGLNEPTDVLSFPAPNFPGSPLGEIAVSVPVAERQARARQIAVDVELAYLVLHGALHLMGYDDNDEPGQKEMVRLMNEIAVEAGLPADKSWASIPETHHVQ